MLRWQYRVFENLKDGKNLQEIAIAWNRIQNEETTRQEAELFHEELKAIIEFQRSIIESEQESEKSEESGDDGATEKRKRKRPIKKGIEVAKTFLESLKEILGDELSRKITILIDLGIEAADLFK